MTTELLDQVFATGRTYNGWLDRPVSDHLLRQLYAHVRMGPTSFNASPMRLLFLRTAAAKERLRPALLASNVAKTMTAPVCAIVAYDLNFWEKLTTLSPSKDVRGYFSNNAEFAQLTALRNSSLQGGYLILGARALGLDCGPMSGFDAAKVDAEFFAGTSWRCNFLCNLGYGDADSLYPRAPRLDFDEACSLL